MTPISACTQLSFGLGTDQASKLATSNRGQNSLEQELENFREFGSLTQVTETEFTGPNGAPRVVPVFVNEFWTARQRQAHSLHEISYRACFKPQLPRFFIERLTGLQDVVYDPFMGRGTTVLEAALLDRVPWGCDINPLSLRLVGPRLAPPSLEEIAARLKAIPWGTSEECPADLLVFYHPETLEQIANLKSYLLERRAAGKLDEVDAWIEMVALNRLTGHSRGFFSVYTLPPNQAVSVISQEKINRKRSQTPPLRNVADIILKKSKQLLGELGAEERSRLKKAREKSKLINCNCASTKNLPSNSVALVVTSPPFLNVVDYAKDNWLRCWFLGIDSSKIALTVPRKLENWASEMTKVFCELHRLLKPGGHVAFEVGEVQRGTVLLETTVLSCGTQAGLQPRLVLINSQKFTKTANCWGIDNMDKGTNSNRIVLFRK